MHRVSDDTRLLEDLNQVWDRKAREGGCDGGHHAVHGQPQEGVEAELQELDTEFAEFEDLALAGVEQLLAAGDLCVEGADQAVRRTVENHLVSDVAAHLSRLIGDAEDTVGP